MNILHSSSDALFATPAELLRDRLPEFDRSIIAREEVVDGTRMVVAMRKRAEGYYRISADDWGMLQLFDGKRSYEEIAALYAAQTGQQCSAEQVREFAEVYRDTDFFYRTATEKHIRLMDEMRRKRRQRRHIDLAEIPILTWDAERYFDWLEPKLRFVFTRWFTLLTLAGFTWMTYIWWGRLGQMWADTVHFYNFAEKGLTDLIAFWLAFGFVVIVHESAHGLTARHWGATVKHMGFLIFYIAPTFYCDVSEAWIYASKWQRITTAFAGAWSELIMCAVATFVWWGTAPGMLIHELAYLIIIVAGIGLIVANLNPLIKLDGYFIFCEMLGIPDLKERSSAYISQWIHNVFGLPAEVPHLRPRRKWFFITYATLSWIYSYVLLLVVAHWIYNIFYHYTPEWAFLAGLAMALWIFRSPLRRLRDFMKTVYLDKKETWRKAAQEHRTRLVLAAAVILVLLFAPLWRETVDGRFLLETPRRAVVRTTVPGTVSEIAVNEGQYVAAGAPVARLRNLEIESAAGTAAADYSQAAARGIQAQLQYANLGETANERERAATLQQTTTEQMTQLNLSSPIAGVVVTPRVRNLLGSYVPAGTTIAEIEDVSGLRARVFVAEPFMHYLRAGAPAVLHLDDSFTTLRGTTAAILPASSGPPPEALIAKSEYQGLQLPSFYPVLVTIDDYKGLRDGMVGTAKIMVRRRSIAGFCTEALRDFFSRRIW